MKFTFIFAAKNFLRSVCPEIEDFQSLATSDQLLDFHFRHFAHIPYNSNLCVSIMKP